MGKSDFWLFRNKSDAKTFLNKFGGVLCCNNSFAATARYLYNCAVLESGVSEEEFPWAVIKEEFF